MHDRVLHVALARQRRDSRAASSARAACDWNAISCAVRDAFCSGARNHFARSIITGPVAARDVARARITKRPARGGPSASDVDTRDCALEHAQQRKNDNQTERNAQQPQNDRHDSPSFDVPFDAATTQKGGSGSEHSASAISPAAARSGSGPRRPDISSRAHRHCRARHRPARRPAIRSMAPRNHRRVPITRAV